MKVKVAPGLYEIRQYYGGPLIATIAKTGTRRDNYPWEWYLHDGVRFGLNASGERPRETGTTQTLGEAVDVIEGRIKSYGLEMEMEK